MSIIIDADKLSREDKSFIQKSLSLTNQERSQCFDVDCARKFVRVPFAFGLKEFAVTPRRFDQVGLYNNDRSNAPTLNALAWNAVNRVADGVPNDVYGDRFRQLFSRYELSDVKFEGMLRDNQSRTANSCVDRLRKNNCAIVSSYPGFGKTIVALYVSTRLFACKTLIVVNKLVLIEQWIDSIRSFTSGSDVQLITAKTEKLDPTASFHIVNAVNMSKKPTDFFDDISFMIVDELHQIVTNVLSQNLLRVSPRYVLGLSATPYRFDEFNDAIAWYFGDEIIGTTLNKKHKVHVVETGFVPKIAYNAKGLDWNAVLESQAADTRRNRLIVDTVLLHRDQTWMILVKRVSHAASLVSLIKDAGVECTTLLGTKTTFDRNCKILIGTTSKIGVGFDHAKVTALCIAADIKNYFVQFLGRCMRNQSIEPLILDFVDEFGPLKKHFAERSKEYTDHGGVIVKYTTRK